MPYAVSREQLAEHLELMGAGDGAVWSVRFQSLRAEDVVELMLAARAGDAMAVGINKCMADTYQAAIHEDAKRHPSCLTCDAEFSSNHAPAFLVLVYSDDMAVSCCICGACIDRHKDQQSLLAATMTAFQKYLGLNVRVLNVHDTVGHA